MTASSKTMKHAMNRFNEAHDECMKWMDCLSKTTRYSVGERIAKSMVLKAIIERRQVLAYVQKLKAL